MQKTNKTTEYVFAENCAGAVRSFMATVLLFYGMVFLATSILEELCCFMWHRFAENMRRYGRWEQNLFISLDRHFISGKIFHT